MTRPSTPELARRIVESVLLSLTKRPWFVWPDLDEHDKQQHYDELVRVVEKELRDR